MAEIQWSDPSLTNKTTWTNPALTNQTTYINPVAMFDLIDQSSNNLTDETGNNLEGTQNL